MTTYQEALEAWLREPLPSDQRERAMEEAVRTMVKAGLEGNLTWAQVAEAMTGLRYAEDEREGDPGDGPSPTVERGAALSEEETVAAEGMAETSYRMTVETQGSSRARAGRPFSTQGYVVISLDRHQLRSASISRSTSRPASSRYRFRPWHERPLTEG